jgi:hypothetical protein
MAKRDRSQVRCWTDLAGRKPNSGALKIGRACARRFEKISAFRPRGGAFIASSYQTGSVRTVNLMAGAGDQ